MSIYYQNMAFKLNGFIFRGSNSVFIHFTSLPNWGRPIKERICPIVANYTARQCSLSRRKFMECSTNNPALTLLMEHLVIGQRLKTPNFSAFHWSPRGSLVSIGQHFVATREVHLPKSTETSSITESNQSGPNH